MQNNRTQSNIVKLQSGLTVKLEKTMSQEQEEEEDRKEPIQKTPKRKCITSLDLIHR